MIALHDMNQSWTAPEGFDFVRVDPQGSYLVVMYARRQAGDHIVRGGLQIVTIYLESQGREVMRTVEEILDPVVEKKPEPKPIPRRLRFWNGVNLALLGLEEIASCLRK